MNEEILIGLGEVLEETKGCPSDKLENASIPNERNEAFPNECPD